MFYYYLDQIAKKLKITEDEIKRLQLEESRLNANENDIENKENNKAVQNRENQEDSSESEMDEEKNTIVRIGDEEDEEETNNHKNSKEDIKDEELNEKKEEIPINMDVNTETTEPEKQNLEPNSS